jgi:hypothetical protein
MNKGGIYFHVIDIMLQAIDVINCISRLCKKKQMQIEERILIVDVESTCNSYCILLIV